MLKSECCISFTEFWQLQSSFHTGRQKSRFSFDQHKPLEHVHWLLSVTDILNSVKCQNETAGVFQPALFPKNISATYCLLHKVETPSEVMCHDNGNQSVLERQQDTPCFLFPVRQGRVTQRREIKQDYSSVCTSPNLFDRGCCYNNLLLPFVSKKRLGYQ